MKVRTMVELSREEINDLSYPVIVQCWGRVMGSMSRKRKYREEFTPEEREVIRRYHNTIIYSTSGIL